MHRIFSLLAIVLIFSSASAQIPNASFENWTDGNPDGWFATNIPGVAVTVTQVQPGADGDYALQGEVVPFLGVGVYPPLIQTWFAIDERPGSLTGSYIFNPVGGDSLYIAVVFYDASLAFGFGAGAITPPATGSSFEQFRVPIIYYDQGSKNDGFVADSCLIQIGIAGVDTVHAGSKMIIDNLAFSGETGTAVEDEPGVPSAFALEQNYPNPFNPATTVRYSLPISGHATLTVSNLLGETVATLLDGELPAGSHEVRFDASGLPSGLYLYTLRSGAFTQTKRMLLLK